MDKPIHAEYLLTQDEIPVLLAAHQKVADYPLKGFVGGLLFAILCLLTPLFGAVLIFETESFLREPILQAFLAIIGMLWIVLILTRPNNFLRRYTLRRGIAALSEEKRIHEFDFSDVEVKASSMQITSVYRWDAFHRLAETPRGFLLYLSGSHFLWVPPHAFTSADDFLKFGELAKSRISHYVVSGPCRLQAKPRGPDCA